MKTIDLSRREYLKSLREANPLDRGDANKRVVSAVGRLTAQKLDKNPAFAEALKNDPKTAGNIWHNTANQVAKRFAARLEKISPAKLQSEKTIKSGAGGSRADVLIASAKRVLAEFDWKTNARSALRSIKQMQKHAGQIKSKLGANPVIQEARNWIDFVRQGAPNAAKHLANAAWLPENKTASRAHPRAQTSSSDAPKIRTGSQAPKTGSRTASGRVLGNRGERLSSPPRSDKARSPASSSSSSSSSPKRGASAATPSEGSGRPLGARGAGGRAANASSSRTSPATGRQAPLGTRVSAAPKISGIKLGSSNKSL
jgi:hypothetical protein